MAGEDGISTGPTTKEGKEKVQKKIEQHLKHQEKYKSLEKQLEETDEVQISTSDPESRQFIVRNMITEVAYNLQSTMDAEHNIPVNYEITNENDSKAMGGMLEQAVEILATMNLQRSLTKAITPVPNLFTMRKKTPTPAL